jgi:hypothetical protein
MASVAIRSEFVYYHTEASDQRIRLSSLQLGTVWIEVPARQPS